MRRLILFSTAVLTVLLVTPQPADSAENAKSVQFISGTASTIPLNIEGSLDATSPSELRFNYGMSAFTLPYEKITGTQVSDTSGRHLWKVPVPKMGKSSRFLTIAYRNGENATALLTFKGSAGSVASLRDAIDQRRTPAPAPETAKTQAKEPVQDDWWGDRYWRTNRNRDKWPSTQEQTGGPVVATGTKD